MRNNGIKFKMKKRLKFRHIYMMILLAITAYFSWHVLDLLVFAPNNAIGSMILGSRMDEIEPLEEEWLRATEAFGATVEHVDDVEVFWNTGPVVYLSVRVEPGLSRRNARAATNTVGAYFAELAGEILRPYNVQVVVFYGDIGEQIAENQAALIQHVHEYNHAFVESLISHAESYPSLFNINRARDNISDAASVMYESVIIVVGNEGRLAMLERINAITPASEEVLAEGPIPQHPGRQITPSNIARFPMWGTWNHNRGQVRWSPSAR